MGCQIGCHCFNDVAPQPVTETLLYEETVLLSDHVPPMMGAPRKGHLELTTNDHPVVGASSSFSNGVRMLRAESLLALENPWPRCQDLPSSSFKLPRPDDMAFAVSHPWLFQTHPDPAGHSAAEVKRLLESAIEKHKPTGDVVGFYDFTSVSQRAFQAGQVERTETANATFREALVCMPQIFLLVDAVLHVDVDPSSYGDGELLRANASLLSGATFAQLGPHVQVTSVPCTGAKTLDLVVGVDGVSSTLTVEEVQRAVGKLPCELLLKRSPYGIPNRTRLDDRGWIFLERFISMVKVALVGEKEARRVVFSNSPKVLEEILHGGKILREAAQKGEERLRETLRGFLKDMSSKTFSFHAGGDAEVVKRIMKKLVKSLPSFWADEVVNQRQRQLHLAVNRGDAQACWELLSSRADVNHLRSGAVTPLHIATKHRNIAVAEVLLQFNADCGAQDVNGECPAHWVPFEGGDEALYLFDLVAPSLNVLMMANAALQTPFERYELFAESAADNRLYPPALLRVEELRREYPVLSAEHKDRNMLARLEAKRLQLATPHSVRQSSVHCRALGRDLALFLWEASEVSVTILWILQSFATTGPLSLHLSSLDWVAQRVCAQRKARLVVLCSWQCVHVSPSTSWSSFCEEVAAVIEVIPLCVLPDKFVLVEEGQPTSLSCRLEHRLSGMLFLSSTGRFDEDFPARKKSCASVSVLAQLLQLAEDHNASSYMTCALKGVGTKVTPELFQSYVAACEALSQAEWDFVVLTIKTFLRGESGAHVRNCSQLDCLPPNTVTAPPSGSKIGLQSTSMLRNSETVFVLESKLMWSVEGEELRVDVTLLLDALLGRLTDGCGAHDLLQEL